MLTPRTRSKTRCLLCRLGLINYDAAYAIQKMIQAQKMSGQISDVLLLLEHYPTFTMGKSSKLENLLLSPEELSRKGISLFFADRGGDITYHGPGQLTVYPIMDLRNRGRDIGPYVRNLEEMVIQTLDDLSIEGRRNGENVGIWVGGDKIASIGISIRRWVTMHGIALNVNPDLKNFTYINPCGLDGNKVTSISKLLGYDVPIETIGDRIAAHFADIFDVEIELVSPNLLRATP